MYTIEWMIRNSPILVYEVFNCTIDSQGFPTWSTAETTVYPKYTERVKFYELNGSLLLHNVQDTDSGLYTIQLSIGLYTIKERISMWVHPEKMSSGPIFGDKIKVYRNIVNVTRGQSVLLPVDYTLAKQVSMYTIEWMIRNSPILFSKVFNCTIDSQGFPTWSTAETTVYPKYTERVKFYELNGSLLLHNVQDTDSGLYTIQLSIGLYTIKERISMWVHPEKRSSDGEAVKRMDIWIFALRTALCFLPIGVLVVLIYLWGC
ncbi:carcinoembryonic antigen-related cell adhesion molecule 3-like isoform X2 [Hyperolius riggenbachi]